MVKCSYNIFEGIIMNIFKKFIPLCLCLSMICTLFGFQTVEGATAYDETISNGSFSDFQQALLNAKEFGLYSYNCSGKVTGGRIANCGKYGIGAYKKGISYSKVKFSNNGANGKCNYYRG